jgi:hypothetical protein
MRCEVNVALFAPANPDFPKPHPLSDELALCLASPSLLISRKDSKNACQVEEEAYEAPEGKGKPLLLLKVGCSHVAYVSPSARAALLPCSASAER